MWDYVDGVSSVRWAQWCRRTRQRVRAAVPTYTLDRETAVRATRGRRRLGRLSGGSVGHVQAMAGELMRPATRGFWAAVASAAARGRAKHEAWA